MARVARCEVFRPEEEAIVHVSNRCVRGLYLMGHDQASGKDYSYRRGWFQGQLKLCAQHFAVDLLEYAVMENHFHLLLRSRPDIVSCWNNRQVARRWLMLSHRKKKKDGSLKELSAQQVNALADNPKLIQELRKRLSDISWFVRKVCQYVAQRANREAADDFGKFWDGRFHAVRLLDEEAVLACSTYINLNPLRAVIVHTIEQPGQFTSGKLRLDDLLDRAEALITAGAIWGEPEQDAKRAAVGQLDDTLPGEQPLTLPAETQGTESFKFQSSVPLHSRPRVYSSPLSQEPVKLEIQLPPHSATLADRLTEHVDQAIEQSRRLRQQEADAADGLETLEPGEPDYLPPAPYKPSGCLAPLEINEATDPLGPRPSRSLQRVSDKGYLPMTLGKYIELLEWSARQIRPDKRGFTSQETPPIIQRLGIPEDVWLKLVTSFGELFSVVAGMPERVDAHRGARRMRFYMPAATRQMLSFRPLSTQDASPEGTAAEQTSSLHAQSP